MYNVVTVLVRHHKHDGDWRTHILSIFHELFCILSVSKFCLFNTNQMLVCKKVERAEISGSAAEDRAACEWVTHSGPPPRLRDGGEVGVRDVTLHSVHHGWKHEDSHTDEQQQTSHLHTQTRVTSRLHVISSWLGCKRITPVSSSLTCPQKNSCFPA